MQVNAGVGEIDITGLPEGVPVKFAVRDAAGGLLGEGEVVTGAALPAKIKTRLSADNTGVEVVLPLPAGTAGITAALLPTLDSKTPTYAHLASTLKSQPGTKALPVIDMAAVDVHGEPIGPKVDGVVEPWAGRIQTKPLEAPTPLPPSPPPSTGITISPGFVMRSLEPSVIQRAFALKGDFVRAEFARPDANFMAFAKTCQVAGIELLVLITDPSVLSDSEVRAFAQPFVKGVEASNEIQYSYKHPTAAIARAYGGQVERLAHLLNPLGVEVLMVGDDGGTGNDMFLRESIAGGPRLLADRLIGGFTGHFYSNQKTGTGIDTYGVAKAERLNASLARYPELAKVPVDQTEYGFAAAEVKAGVGMALSSGGEMTGQHMSFAEAGQAYRLHLPKVIAALKGRARRVANYQSEDQKVVIAGQTEREFYFGDLLAQGHGDKGPYTQAVEDFVREHTT